MILDRLKGLLFGSIRKIDIHCGSPAVGTMMKSGILATLAGLHVSVPISVKPPERDVEFVTVYYNAGLLRPAHADVMVLQ
jgi:hypothetical protein